MKYLQARREGDSARHHCCKQYCDSATRHASNCQASHDRGQGHRLLHHAQPRGALPLAQLQEAVVVEQQLQLRGEGLLLQMRQGARVRGT